MKENCLEILEDIISREGNFHLIKGGKSALLEDKFTSNIVKHKKFT